MHAGMGTSAASDRTWCLLLAIVAHIDVYVLAASRHGPFLCPDCLLRRPPGYLPVGVFLWVRVWHASAFSGRFNRTYSCCVVAVYRQQPQAFLPPFLEGCRVSGGLGLSWLAENPRRKLSASVCLEAAPKIN